MIEPGSRPVRRQYHQIHILTNQFSEQFRESQIEKLDTLKAERDNMAVNAAIEEIKNCARGNDNLMPSIMGAVKCYATLGEICDALRGVFGEYTAGSTL